VKKAVKKVKGSKKVARKKRAKKSER